MWPRICGVAILGEGLKISVQILFCPLSNPKTGQHNHKIKMANKVMSLYNILLKTLKSNSHAFLYCFMCAFSSASLAAPVITLSTTDVISNYFHTAEMTGLADEVLAEAFRLIGFELEVVILPTERSLKMAKDGLVDGELMRTRAIEKEYPSLIRVPEPLVDVEFSVFSNTPIDLTNGWSSLAGKSVGLVIGMKIIEKNVPKDAQVSGVKSIEQLFGMLNRGRVDYVVMPRGIGQDFLQDNGLSHILISDQALVSVPAFTYLHLKHASLAPRLEEAIRKVKKSGEYKKILDRHKNSKPSL